MRPEDFFAEERDRLDFFAEERDELRCEALAFVRDELERLPPALFRPRDDVEPDRLEEDLRAVAIV